jgi:hypothetical protein
MIPGASSGSPLSFRQEDRANPGGTRRGRKQTISRFPFFFDCRWKQWVPGRCVRLDGEGRVPENTGIQDQPVGPVDREGSSLQAP